jgi:hypothetical protein
VIGFIVAADRADRRFPPRAIQSVDATAQAWRR